MGQPEHPHECHPDLQEERLLSLAQFFACTRSAVVSLHDPLSGDDAWSLGCRGFARWRNLLTQKSKSGEWSWLGIVNPGKKFIFSIGSVPVRFYRGSIKRPPFRTLASNAQELTQMSLAFATEDDQYRNLKWRFAIETDFLGEPSAVIFAGLAGDDGAVVCHWKLPFDTENIEIDLGAIRDDDVVELPAPTVGKLFPKKRNAANDA
jgi:hypothetical protein